ncbi:MAG: hypothetical protein EBR30_05215 [Cytophagia bacterium]|nr:hypothetical protein [Cytophagia bacterium]
MEYTIQAQAFSLLQQGKYTEAVDLLDKYKLFQQSVSDSEILKLFNNYLIACFHIQQFERGANAFEVVQDFAPLNPPMYHNAACLYCKMQMYEKAIAQVKLARKYGSMSLMLTIKADNDLASISTHPEFKQAVLPLNKKFSCEKITIPFEGVNHLQFDELAKDEMISMFFIFRLSFEEVRKKKVRESINKMVSKEEWRGVLVDHSRPRHGWRDSTLIGKDFITLHIKNIWQPKPLMQEALVFAQSLEEQLLESFFVKRELEGNSFGTTSLAVTESSLAAAFSPFESETDFWYSSFSYSMAYPTPEYSGRLISYGHHDGSEAIELRGIVYDPLFRISYGLVHVALIEDRERALTIYQFMQDELSRYFVNDVPVIMNKVGDQKLDCIIAYGRIGYAFEITIGEALEQFYTRYAFRLKEAELFKVVKDAITRFNLSHVIHWHRNYVFSFHIWERFCNH